MSKIKHRTLDRLLYKISEEDQDLVSHFVEVNKTIPSYYYVEGEIGFDQLFEYLDRNYKDKYVITWRVDYKDYKQVSFVLQMDEENILFVRTGRARSMLSSIFDFGEKKKKKSNPDNFMYVFNDIDILYDVSKGIPTGFINAMEKLIIKEKGDTNVINLICHDQEIGLYTKSLPITGDLYDFDLDLHYGEGTKKFHEILLKRVQQANKGLILLYGPHGTGKTFYIKRLIKDLTLKNKKILYLPNNMVDQLGTPTFNNFLIEWIDDNIAKGEKKSVLMVIEDAERVLLKRDENPFSADGVSNILNSTDGILNDFLNIQVLATFNTSIDKIDEAVLRKKRALSIREFGKLSKDESQRLVDHLKIEYEVSAEMSLADIFALADEEQDSVLFNTKKKTPKIGFK